MDGEPRIGIKEWLDEVISNLKNQIADFSAKQTESDKKMSASIDSIRTQVEEMRRELLREMEVIRKQCTDNDKAVDGINTRIRAYAVAAMAGGGILGWVIKIAVDLHWKFPTGVK